MAENAIRLCIRLITANSYIKYLQPTNEVYQIHDNNSAHSKAHRITCHQHRQKITTCECDINMIVTITGRLQLKLVETNTATCQGDCVQKKIAALMKCTCTTTTQTEVCM